MEKIRATLIYAFILAVMAGLTTGAFGAELLELRVICESGETKALRASKKWKNPPAAAWYASREARSNTTGFAYAGRGYSATIEIMGTKSDMRLVDKKFLVLTKNNTSTNRVLTAEEIPGGIRFSNVDMGEEGAISIALGPILDHAKPFVIKIQPNGWMGTGNTWKGKFFQANYDYRKDNQSVLPEMFAICR